MNSVSTRCECVSFHGQPGFLIYITLGSVHKQVSHYGVLLMCLLLSKKSQLLSFQMKKGTLPWAKICPLARLLKSHQIKTYPVPILTITVKGMNFQQF